MFSFALLTLEARSARVAATLDARPELGALWRRLVAITEAASSLSMEDIPVPEHDIVLRDLGSAQTLGDPQAARIATQIHAFLKRPGDLISDPGEVFDRAVGAGRLTEVIDEAKGGRVAYLSSDEKLDWQDARQDFIEAAPRILRHEAPIVLKLLTLSRVVTFLLPERMPIAERLMFMSAESTLRRELALSDPLIKGVVGETDLGISALWTMTPSTALSRSGFRSWSPASQSGANMLMERLDRCLGQNVGKLARLHQWMGQIEAFAESGRSGKSRRADLAALIARMPILNTQAVAKELRITDRGARKLLDEARQENLITLMTPRRFYRIWAVPALAEMIQDHPLMTPPVLEPAQQAPLLQDARPERDRIDRDGNRAAVEAALGELDRAMAAADRLLAKYNYAQPSPAQLETEAEDHSDFS